MQRKENSKNSKKATTERQTNQVFSHNFFSLFTKKKHRENESVERLAKRKKTQNVIDLSSIKEDEQDKTPEETDVLPTIIQKAQNIPNGVKPKEKSSPQNTKNYAIVLKTKDNDVVQVLNTYGREKLTTSVSSQLVKKIEMFFIDTNPVTSQRLLRKIDSNEMFLEFSKKFVYDDFKNFLKRIQTKEILEELCDSLISKESSEILYSSRTTVNIKEKRKNYFIRQISRIIEEMIGLLVPEDFVGVFKNGCQTEFTELFRKAIKAHLKNIKEPIIITFLKDVHKLKNQAWESKLRFLVKQSVNDKIELFIQKCEMAEKNFLKKLKDSL